jgi:hypothetical protein
MTLHRPSGRGAAMLPCPLWAGRDITMNGVTETPSCPVHGGRFPGVPTASMEPTDLSAKRAEMGRTRPGGAWVWVGAGTWLTDTTAARPTYQRRQRRRPRGRQDASLAGHLCRRRRRRLRRQEPVASEQIGDRGGLVGEHPSTTVTSALIFGQRGRRTVGLMSGRRPGGAHGAARRGAP